MKKSHILLLAFATAAATLSARQLTGEEAKARALAEWPATTAHRAPAASQLTTIHQAEGAYVIDKSNGGYIIAPADDALPAVLAYIPDGQYHAEQMPPAFHAWLHEATTAGVAKAPFRLKSKVDQLLDDIAWTQDTPMNDLCPVYPYGGYNYRTYAGCVAIAMGQIMRYHQHPAQGAGSASYTTDSYGLSVETNIGAHTYDWTKILPNYRYTSPTKEQKEEVAKLVYDIAAATQMDFTPNASNTQDFRAAQALRNNFGYDQSLTYIDHRFYTTEEWANTLRAELDAERPVYLSGANVYGSESNVAGHAFVVDGYDEQGRFHINWGWNGDGNGWYLLTDLTPTVQGAGGSNGGYAFMQNAIIGIQPDKGGDLAPATLCLIYDQIWPEQDENGTSINFTVANPTATDFTGLMALRITDGNGNLVNDPTANPYKLTCKAGFAGERGWYIDLKTLGAGKHFELIYQRDGETEWHVAKARNGSPYSLVSYTTSTGSISLGYNQNELFVLRLADLTATSELKTGKVGVFSARVKNESDYEYFAPLYLEAFDKKGESILGYTNYQLCLVPAHGEATIEFCYTLPAEKGDYKFCVAYEDLGYNYSYVPMMREGEPTEFYTFNVTDATTGGDNPGGDNPGGGGGTIIVPDGTEVDYVFECVAFGEDAVRRDVKVRFESNDVYIKGLSEEVPEGWIHGTISNGVAVFEQQLVGEWRTASGKSQQQYFAGAVPYTYDITDVILSYDATTRSFTAYDNVYMLLTVNPELLSYGIYDHLFNNVSILPASVAGEDPTVAPPADLKTATYQVKAVNPYNGVPTDYTVSVGYDGSDFYMQGLYPAFPKAWVKGSINEGKAKFKSPQYVGNYHGLYNMYVAGVNPETELMGELVMTYDEATKTFASTFDCWFIAQCGEANLMPMMLLDEMTIAPYVAVTPIRTLVTLPAGKESAVCEYKLEGLDPYENSKQNRSISVLLDGSDVYVKGFSTYLPDAWAKGTIENNIAVFPRNQFMGTMENYDFWLGAGDAMSGEMIYGNLVFLYNPANGVFTQPESNYLAINVSTTEVNPLEMLHQVVLTPVGTNGLDCVLAPTAEQRIYDLSGRRLAAPTKGISIIGGKRVVR